MADNIIIPDPEPQYPIAVQADGPLMSAHETQMAAQTTGLWVKGTADYKCLFWPDVGYLGHKAPRAALSSASRTGAFLSYSDNCTYTFPWYYHPRATRIQCRMVLAHDTQHVIQVRVSAQKLLAADTTPTVTGQRSARSDQVPAHGPLAGHLAAGVVGVGYNRLTHLTASVVPTIDGTRFIAIKPEAYYSAAPVASTVSIGVFLIQLEIWNVLESPE